MSAYNPITPSIRSMSREALDAMREQVLRAVDACGGADVPDESADWNRGYREALDAAELELTRLFDRISACAAQHTHVADHSDGQGGERCLVCQRSFRDPVHLNAAQLEGRKYLNQSRDYHGFAGMSASEMGGY